MLCGDFPVEILDRGRNSTRYFDDQGQPVPLSNPSSEFNRVVYSGWYSITLQVGDLLSRVGHSPEELCEIVDFLSSMLIIDPKERWSATQLLDHP